MVTRTNSKWCVHSLQKNLGTTIALFHPTIRYHVMKIMILIKIVVVPGIYDKQDSTSFQQRHEDKNTFTHGTMLLISAPKHTQ